MTIGLNAAKAIASGEKPRPATIDEPGERVLSAPWKYPGVYLPASNAISEAPELAGALGPWAVSIDFN